LSPRGRARYGAVGVDGRLHLEDPERSEVNAMAGWLWVVIIVLLVLIAIGVWRYYGGRRKV